MSENDQRITWIASYPKSGSTWVRALLGAWFNEGPVNVNAWPRPVSCMDLWPSHYQACSPRPLSNLHPDALLYLRGAALQHVLCNPDPIFCKTHMCRAVTNGVTLIPEWMTKNSIYIVRNPFDVAVSFAHHMDVSFDEAIEVMVHKNAVLGKHGGVGLFHVLGRWDDNVRSWCEQEPIPSIVRYEDLHLDPFSTFTNLLESLGMDTDERRIREAVSAADFNNLSAIEAAEDFQERRQGTFFRSGKILWGEELTKEQRNRIADEFGETIQCLYPDVGEEMLRGVS